MSKARDYIDGLAARGQHHFTAREMGQALDISAAAAKLALLRLAKQGEVASPARGFYVIVPPEYRQLGCLPADQFIPALMKHHGLAYYAGLLSAAQYHGAAHHRPQEFQVVVPKNRRSIMCGAVRIAFIARKRIADVPVQKVNTPRGTVRVSSVEATAVDLVGYEGRAGGLDQVATVLAELAEQIDPERLVAAAKTAPVPWAQRLGYLLEHVGAAKRAEPLKAYVRIAARDMTPLLPSASRAKARQERAWRLYVNAEVEAET
ncbi:MAG TPA: type IV toxin-antitoxin system AbiEi family antitoxin [Alphaproteobacteria bacterium]|nr:type IV toxin-antitoxin system AbiEi family antitoxin [Alphaproteobacteria bacterium]